MFVPKKKKTKEPEEEYFEDHESYQEEEYEDMETYVENVEDDEYVEDDREDRW